MNLWMEKNHVHRIPIKVSNSSVDLRFGSTPISYQQYNINRVFLRRRHLLLYAIFQILCSLLIFTWSWTCRDSCAHLQQNSTKTCSAEFHLIVHISTTSIVDKLAYDQELPLDMILLDYFDTTISSHNFKVYQQA